MQIINSYMLDFEKHLVLIELYSHNVYKNIITDFVRAVFSVCENITWMSSFSCFLHESVTAVYGMVSVSYPIIFPFVVVSFCLGDFVF